jgi:hypothetical protein
MMTKKKTERLTSSEIQFVDPLVQELELELSGRWPVSERERMASIGRWEMGKSQPTPEEQRLNNLRMGLRARGTIQWWEEEMLSGMAMLSTNRPQPLVINRPDLPGTAWASIRCPLSLTTASQRVGKEQWDKLRLPYQQRLLEQLFPERSLGHLPPQPPQELCPEPSLSLTRCEDLSIIQQE